MSRRSQNGVSSRPVVRGCSALRGRAAASVPWLSLLAWLAAYSVALPARADRAEREACLHAHEHGQELRLKRDFLSAREQLAACARPSCPKLLQQDCEKLLREVEAALPTLRFSVSAPDGEPLQQVRLFVDGELLTERIDGRVLSLNPGHHRLRVEAVGHEPYEQELTVEPGEQERAVHVRLPERSSEPTPARVAPSPTPVEPPRVAPPPAKQVARRAVAPDPGPSLRRISYGLGGAAVASLSVGVVTGLLGRREKDELDRACELGPCDDPGSATTRKRGRRLYYAANTAFGVSGALLLAAGTTFLVHRLRDKDDRTELSAAIDGQSASLLLRRPF